MRVVEQGPVHAGRRHFQSVFASDGILDIEDAADLTTDAFAVIDGDAVIRLVDIDSQDAAASLPDLIDPPERDTQRLDGWTDHVCNSDQIIAHSVDHLFACISLAKSFRTNKKWACGPLLNS